MYNLNIIKETKFKTCHKSRNKQLSVNNMPEYLTVYKVEQKSTETDKKLLQKNTFAA